MSPLVVKRKPRGLKKQTRRRFFFLLTPWPIKAKLNDQLMTGPPTRDKIIHTAMKLFWEQGYHATGLAQILRESGVNSGSLYYFFRSKEDLLHAVLESYRDGIEPMLVGPATENVEGALDKVFSLLGGYRRQLLESDYRHGCPIGNLALELRDVHPRASQLVSENFSAWRRTVESWLMEAGLGDAARAQKLAGFILTVMEGAVMQCCAYRTIEPFDEALELLKGQLLQELAEKEKH